MDVETVLLCDVLPDGTVAATVLVEPVYDTISGDRVGTRLVDPATGAAYVQVGTLTSCGATAAEPGSSVQTWPLCVLDNATGNVLQHVRAEQVYDADGAASGFPRIVDAVSGGPVALPGGAHIGVCPDGAPCASPTQPTATVGLCLPDGTPIAVTVVRDCAGTVTSEGWLNLRTGAFSAGAPPAGTVACGDSGTITVSGTFCDVDSATADVLGLVLIEYSYAADGTIAGVRLVDATTGATYTPQGEVTVCPAGVEQPEQDIVQLCDVQADGTVVQMIRDYRRDEAGAITGHTDYLLDGSPYQPTGTVGVCAEPCRTVTTETLCDSTPLPLTVTVANTDPTPLHKRFPNLTWDTPVDGTAFFDGGSVVLPESATGGANGTFRATACLVTVEEPCCDTDTVTLTISTHVTNDGPDAGVLADGTVGLFNGPTMVHSVAVANNFPVGRSQTVVLTADVAMAELLAGRIMYAVGLETNQDGARKSWTLDQFGITAVPAAPAAGCGNRFERVRVLDCANGAIVTTVDRTLDGQPYTPVGAVGDCPSCTQAPSVAEVDRIVQPLCDVAPAGTRPFLRHWTVDNTTGQLTRLLDTGLDGTTAYTTTGTVTVCGQQPDQPVLTGVRNVTGTAVQNLAGAFPGLQSVSIAALVDSVLVTMSDGTSVPIPAGVTMTWSVSKDRDQALAVASFTGATASTAYLLNWTYR
ncbi:hypothetical protein ACFC09_15565 [Streptomyces sp. NPDC056161]|uniref:hypothetical protein n=1 Tax=Streptomyces sp. NPDC056161 TaxID=3345732 RepID=UPI0035D54A93